MGGSIYKQRTSFSFILVAIGVILVGVLLLYASQGMDASSVRRPIVAELGSVLIGSTGLALLWELIGKRQFVEEIFESVHVSQDVQNARIVGVCTDFMGGLNWSREIDSAKELDIMFYAGGTWRNTNLNRLQAMVRRPNCQIRLILPDPEDERLVAEMAHRFGYEPEKIRTQILESQTFFVDLVNAPGALEPQLEIFFFKEAPLYSFYRIDTLYILAMYRHIGKGEIPTMACRKGGTIANFVDEQVQGILSKPGATRRVYPPQLAAALPVDG